MKKEKHKEYYFKDQFSQDADENDRYLFKLQQLADAHPELRTEYECFRYYQAGFTNGVLSQILALRRGFEEMKDHDKEKEYAREFYNGADGICFDQQTKFKELTKEQFIEWVDHMAAKGDIPQGEWQDNEWLGLTFVFNKSFVESEE
jgi:hypothetical protein|tara:strand:+ start:28 stop:468 length:441 start_codon:yes stop_codon:yes gene_type:complete